MIYLETKKITLESSSSSNVCCWACAFFPSTFSLGTCNDEGKEDTNLEALNVVPTSYSDFGSEEALYTERKDSSKSQLESFILIMQFQSF